MGKKIFTKDEANQIKKLIVEKLHATQDKQKVIRAKIRRIGFYFSDFSSKKNGYSIEDFERLIHSGMIKIIENNTKSTFPRVISRPVRERIKETNNVSFQHGKNSFEPLVDDNTEILILGTMPGDHSLSVGEYYAHAGNRFWKIIAKITNDNVPASYSEKKIFLSKHKIGLWDVAKKVNREGSLDSNISNEIPNDINLFLNNHPKIRVIGFNGNKAVALFDKFFDKQQHIIYHNLTSTSGANTSLTYEDNCNDWKRILD